jgi:hypothetical protein
VAQLVEYQPSKCEAPYHQKKKKMEPFDIHQAIVITIITTIITPFNAIQKCTTHFV